MHSYFKIELIAHLNYFFIEQLVVTLYTVCLFKVGLLQQKDRKYTGNYFMRTLKA